LKEKNNKETVLPRCHWSTTANKEQVKS